MFSVPFSGFPLLLRRRGTKGEEAVFSSDVRVWFVWFKFRRV
jgi:hypothetical protein